LEPEGGEQERAGEGFEAVGLAVVVGGRAGERQVRVAGLHECGERLEQAAGGSLPMEVGAWRLHDGRSSG
jgi:hypothetical protein